METQDDSRPEPQAHEETPVESYMWRRLPPGAPPFDGRVWSPADGLLPETRSRLLKHVMKIWNKKQAESRYLGYFYLPPQGVHVVEHTPLPRTDLMTSPQITTTPLRAWFIDSRGIVETATEHPIRERLQSGQLYCRIGSVNVAPCVGSNTIGVIQYWGPRAASGMWMSIEPYHAISAVGGVGWVS